MVRRIMMRYAAENFLQAQEGEINIIITFDDAVLNIYRCDNGSAEEMETLYEHVAAEEIGGGTDMYCAAEEALQLIQDTENLDDYSPAIILMTDGASTEGRKEEFVAAYQQSGLDIPIFSIMFGSSEEGQLQALAELSNARVFDGRADRISAFRSVKGYN